MMMRKLLLVIALIMGLGQVCYGAGPYSEVKILNDSNTEGNNVDVDDPCAGTQTNEIKTEIYDTGTGPADVTTSGSDAKSNTFDSLSVSGYQYGFNGTSWDRLRIVASTESAYGTVSGTDFDDGLLECIRPNTDTELYRILGFNISTNRNGHYQLVRCRGIASESDVLADLECSSGQNVIAIGANGRIASTPGVIAVINKTGLPANVGVLIWGCRE